MSCVTFSQYYFLSFFEEDECPRKSDYSTLQIRIVTHFRFSLTLLHASLDLDWQLNAALEASFKQQMHSVTDCIFLKSLFITTIFPKLGMQLLNATTPPLYVMHVKSKKKVRSRKQLGLFHNSQYQQSNANHKLTYTRINIRTHSSRDSIAAST